MDDIDFLNERELPTVRREGRATTFTADTGLPVSTFGSAEAEDLRRGLVECLKEDADLARLGIDRASVGRTHAKFLGASVEAPVPGAPTLRFPVLLDFGPGLIDRITVQEIIDDNTMTEVKMIRSAVLAAA